MGYRPKLKLFLPRRWMGRVKGKPTCIKEQIGLEIYALWFYGVLWGVGLWFLVLGATGDNRLGLHLPYTRSCFS